MSKVNNWNDFQNKYNFEEVVYSLTKKSIKMISESSLKEEQFCSFAFNCSAYNGYVLLSLDTDQLNKARKFYPPDWTYEELDSYISGIRELWEEGYEPIEDEYFSIVEDLDDQVLFENFTNGFLTSLRKVMVRLERDNVLSTYLNTTPSIWTLVTEIDADEEEEERLLDVERQKL